MNAVLALTALLLPVGGPSPLDPTLCPVATASWEDDTLRVHMVVEEFYASFDTFGMELGTDGLIYAGVGDTFHDWELVGFVLLDRVVVAGSGPEQNTGGNVTDLCVVKFTALPPPTFPITITVAETAGGIHAIPAGCRWKL